jgi:NADPH:quinone reductase-like Zn-dependent oxidoreductase
MKAIGLTEFGGPEVLRVVDLPEPQPGPGEVRITVHAVAVNPTDLTFRAGRRAAQLADRPPPYIPGMDAAGVIDKLGAGTDGRLAVGDPVIAYVIPVGPHGGSYAEQIVVGQASVVPAPRGSRSRRRARCCSTRPRPACHWTRSPSRKGPRSRLQAVPGQWGDTRSSWRRRTA